MSPTSSTPTAQALERARQTWQGLDARERAGVQLAGAALGLLLIVSVGLQPALRTLKAAPLQLAELDLQLQQMQQSAAEAQTLRQLPAIPAAQTRQALQSATEFLGADARLSLQGERATLSFNELSAESLMRWLSEVRGSARARPIEAQLQRGPRGYGGRIVLALAGSAP